MTSSSNRELVGVHLALHLLLQGYGRGFQASSPDQDHHRDGIGRNFASGFEPENRKWRMIVSVSKQAGRGQWQQDSELIEDEMHR